MTTPTVTPPERPGDATNGERTPRVSDTDIKIALSLGVEVLPWQLYALDLRDERAASAAREAEIARLNADLIEAKRENEVLAKSIRAQEHANDPCPFANPRFQMDTDKPSPVCGDLGSGDAPSRCVTKGSRS